MFSILLAPSIIFGIMPKRFYGFIQEPETTQVPEPGLSAFLRWFCWRPPVGILQLTYTVLCQLIQGGLACVGFYLILHFGDKEHRDAEDGMTDNIVFLMNFGMAALLSIFNNVIWALKTVSCITLTVFSSLSIFCTCNNFFFLEKEKRYLYALLNLFIKVILFIKEGDHSHRFLQRSTRIIMQGFSRIISQGSSRIILQGSSLIIALSLYTQMSINITYVNPILRHSTESCCLL